MDHDLESDVLVLGCAGEVSFHAVSGLAIRKYAANRPLVEVREVSLEAVRNVVDAGHCQIGVLRGGQFVDMTADAELLLDRVRDEFDGTVDGKWRHMFWLRNTSAGDGRVSTLPEDYDPFEEDWRSGG